jgi:hypothetical protein
MSNTEAPNVAPRDDDREFASYTRHFRVPHYLPPMSPTRPREPISIVMTVAENDHGQPERIIFQHVDDELLFEMLSVIAEFGSYALILGARLEDLAQHMQTIISKFAHYERAKLFTSIVAHVGHELAQWHAERARQLSLLPRDVVGNE